MSLYKKPAKMKYTDMCIYIDNNVYREDLTEAEENTIYEYLYHIARMLAFKSNYFKRNEYYDDFAIYFATSMFLRFKNPKQFQIDEETGEPKLAKIKSVLNYMKNVAYMRKVEFEQDYYSQAFSPALDEDDEDVTSYDINYSFADKLSETMDDISAVEFDLCLGDICLTTKNFLKQIPYKRGTVVWYNIYLSCLLTLLNIFTISNRNKERLNALKNDFQAKPKTVENLFKGGPETFVILYHLDKSMRDYIWILVQEIRHLMAKDLSLTTHTFIPATSALNMIAVADINLSEYTDYED